MPNLFSKFFPAQKKDLLNFSVLHTDMHAHLLPGIDDGATDITAALALISGLQELGFKKCIATPHIMPGVFDNDADIIFDRQSALNAAALPALGTEVQAAAEYFIDESFPERVRAGEQLLTFGDNYVLVEMSMILREKKLEEAFFEMRLRGYRPVLAHVERYPYLFDKQQLDEYEKLRDADVHLQVNLRSFTGNYGEIQKRIARVLAEHRMISFLGTDLHNAAQLPILAQAMADGHVQRLMESGTLLNAML